MTHKFEIAGHEGYITVGLYPDGQPGEIFLKMAKEGSTVSGLMDSFATTVSVALQYGVPLRDLVNKFAHVRFEPAGFTGNPRDPDRQVHDRLHLPLARRPLPAHRRAGQSLGLITREEPDAPSGWDRRVGARRPSASAHDRHVRYAGGAARRRPWRRTLPRRLRAEARLDVLIPLAEGTSNGNGHTNGHGNGNGHATPVIRAAQPGRHQGQLRGQLGLPSCADCGSIMVRNGSCYKCLNCGCTSGCS